MRLRQRVYFVLAAVVLAAVGAWGGELNNPCRPETERPGACWEWDGTNCVWVYCPGALPGEKCCEKGEVCERGQEDEICCGGCGESGGGGVCTWGGGSGKAEGYGGGPSATRAAGSGPQGVVDFQIKLGSLPGEAEFAGIARIRTLLPATNWAGASELEILRHARAELSVTYGAGVVEGVSAPEMEAEVVADAGGRSFELRCGEKGAPRTGDPPVSWRVEAAADGAWVRFTKFSYGATNSVTEYAAAADGNGIIVTEGGDTRGQVLR
jgi:hypothetical protein